MNRVRWFPPVGLLLGAAPAWCQCVMCQTAASAQRAQAAKSMNFAILILLTPAITLFCGIIYFAFRCRNAAVHEIEEREPCESRL